jgi:hypothetical protein
MKEILSQLSELQELKKAFIDLKQQSDKTAEVVIAQKERSKSRSRKEVQDETSQETSYKSHGPEFEKSIEDSKDPKKSKTSKPSKEDKKENKKSSKSKSKDKQEKQETNTSGGVESSQDKLSHRNKASILKNPKHESQPIKIGRSKTLKPTQKLINSPNDVYKQMNDMANKNYQRGK